MDGDHSLERSLEITEMVLQEVFHQLHLQGTFLEGLILKPNMIAPGLSCPQENSASDGADATMKCLLRSVPAAVGGIAFLSGGQPAELASVRLNAISLVHNKRQVWPLTFSFFRALQLEALAIWSGDPQKVGKAQGNLRHFAKQNSAARRGALRVAL